MKFLLLLAQGGIIDPKDVNLPQKTPDGSTLPDILAIVFAVAGALCLLIIVLSGFLMIISAGEPSKVAKARQSILYAVVGLVICIFAFTIVRFVISRA